MEEAPSDHRRRLACSAAEEHGWEEVGAKGWTGWASGEEEGHEQDFRKDGEEAAEHSYHQQKVEEAQEEPVPEEKVALAWESQVRCSRDEEEQEEPWAAEAEEQGEQEV